jgi:hypothetical protein
MCRHLVVEDPVLLALTASPLFRFFKEDNGPVRKHTEIITAKEAWKLTEWAETVKEYMEACLNDVKI